MHRMVGDRISTVQKAIAHTSNGRVFRRELDEQAGERPEQREYLAAFVGSVDGQADTVRIVKDKPRQYGRLEFCTAQVPRDGAPEIDSLCH